MTGDLGYYVVHVPDAVRAKAFYHTVLGWRAEPGEDPERYYHVEGSAPAGGINGGARPHISTYFLVDDASTAAQTIRELGGQAPDPARSASGWSAECVDDQGGVFSIWQPGPGYAPDGPAKPTDGDLFHFVVQAADDGKAQRFYGTLLGWEFTPGSVPHGWNIHNIEPVGGLFGAGEPGPSRSTSRSPTSRRRSTA